MTLTTNEGHSGKLGGSQMLNVISEAGLYTIILKSREPEAKAFKRWITCKKQQKLQKKDRHILSIDFLEKINGGALWQKFLLNLSKEKNI